MTNKYTFEDIPQILNSISWQLKRIADSLEKEDELPNTAPVEEPKNITTKKISNIREMIEKLK
jgi:cob(I)alamin adenosyltransferase